MENEEQVYVYNYKHTHTHLGSDDTQVKGSYTHVSAVGLDI